MPHLIDRRRWGKNRSRVNRQRFIRRFKQQIKHAIAEQINKRGVTDLESGESVGIPTRDTREPTFRQGDGGHRERVFPGNKEFVTGDRIPRPLGGGGQGHGRRASDEGQSQDEFRFELTRDEYIDLLFDDLELPRLDITQLKNVERYKSVRAGFRTDGVPTNLNVVRSLQRSLARRVALGGEARAELRELEDRLRKQEEEGEEPTLELRKRIEELRERLKRIPFIDTIDLRFNAYVKQPIPATQAVMFCLMDVSGSMDQARKDIAKRFFLLLYLFLSKTYNNVQVVFIRHHTQAKEVDENEFFHSQESGGTVVSSALHLLDDIIRARYAPELWNIYVAQASDGDNWSNDSPICRDLLENRLLKRVRYYAYIEIAAEPQGLWHHYEQLLPTHPNFALQRIRQPEDIYPVFRELFRKQHA